MTDKMREAFENLCKECGPTISFYDFEMGWDAAQAELAAELERLRKDAERGRLLINRGEWLRFDHDTPDAYALLAVRLPYTADLSCKAMREDAIDAAIAAEGEKE